MGVEAGRQLQAGDCFGLLGPKRAGKTTTIETCEGSAERASMQTGLRDDFFQPRSEPSLIHTQHFQACSQERPFSNPLSLDELRARSQLIEAQGVGKRPFLRAGLKVLCVNQGGLRSGLEEIVPQPG